MIKELEIIENNKYDYKVRYKGRVIQVWLDGCSDPSILIDDKYQSNCVHIVQAMLYIDELETNK